jgi:hypothetical protein
MKLHVLAVVPVFSFATMSACSSATAPAARSDASVAALGDAGVEAAAEPCTNALECSVDGIAYPKDRWGFSDRVGLNTFADGGVYTFYADGGGSLPDGSVESAGLCTVTNGVPNIEPGTQPGSRLPNKQQLGFRKSTLPLGEPEAVAPAMVYDPNTTRGFKVGRVVVTESPLFLPLGWLNAGSPLYISMVPNYGSKFTLSEARGRCEGLRTLAPGSVCAYSLDYPSAPSTPFLPPVYPNIFYIDLRSMEVLQFCVGGPSTDVTYSTDPFVTFWEKWANANPPSY